MSEENVITMSEWAMIVAQLRNSSFIYIDIYKFVTFVISFLVPPHGVVIQKTSQYFLERGEE